MSPGRADAHQRDAGGSIVRLTDPKCDCLDARDPATIFNAFLRNKRVVASSQSSERATAGQASELGPRMLVDISGVTRSKNADTFTREQWRHANSRPSHPVPPP